MDRKIEKYINYVVDDMIKKTEIDYDQETITLPFLLPLTFNSFPFTHSIFTLSFPPNLFSIYIKNLYGIRDEEAQTIWDQYRNRIQTLINNE
mgnify:CR=1 FL=1